MKKKTIFILVLAALSYQRSSAQEKLNVDLASVKNITFSNIKQYSRYADPTNPIIVRCGYYNVSDGCFYQCDGNKICKADKKDIKDGKGCCTNKTLCFNNKALGENWGDDMGLTGTYRYIGLGDSSLKFRAPDNTILSVKVHSLTPYTLTANTTYQLNIIH